MSEDKLRNRRIHYIIRTLTAFDMPLHEALSFKEKTSAEYSALSKMKIEYPDSQKTFDLAQTNKIIELLTAYKTELKNQLFAEKRKSSLDAFKQNKPLNDSEIKFNDPQKSVEAIQKASYRGNPLDQELNNLISNTTRSISELNVCVHILKNPTDVNVITDAEKAQLRADMQSDSDKQFISAVKKIVRNAKTAGVRNEDFDFILSNFEKNLKKITSSKLSKVEQKYLKQLEVVGEAYIGNKNRLQQDNYFEGREKEVIPELDAFKGNLDKYLEKRTAYDKTHTGEYFYKGLFKFFRLPNSFSFTEKKGAVEQLKKALNGEEVNLTKEHLAVLRNGNLGVALRDLIREGHADVIAGKKCTTVRDFVQAVNENVDSKYSRRSLFPGPK
ncbi:MAG: hypothetical protein QNK11_08660 [Legionella sp.]|nr:hypothetical protein [Legionella sp.]